MSNIYLIKEKIQKHLIDFDTFTDFITNREIVDEVTKLIPNGCGGKDYLAAWVLYKFPDISMNKNLDPVLHNLAKQVTMFDEFGDKFVSVFNSYKSRFDTWKIDDKQILQESIFIQYHQFGVDLLNAETDDDKGIIKQSRLNLLQTARKIAGDDFVEEIKSFKPVVLNTEELGNQLNKAFWDNFKTKFESEDFSLLYVVIRQLCDVLISICPSKKRYINDILDQQTIKQHIESNSKETIQ